MFDGDVHAFHVAQNRATLLLQGGGELSNFDSRGVEELVKFFAERRIVGSDGSQNPGVVERRIERLFQFPHACDDFGIEQRIQVLAGKRLFLQRIEAPQQLNVFLGQRRRIGVREDFNQRDLERRKRERAIKTIAAAVPLSGDAGVAI